MKHIKIVFSLLLIFNIIFCSCSTDEDNKEQEDPTGPIVYVAGIEQTNSVGYAKLWRNGSATNLNNGTASATAHKVHVSGNDVYVAGEELSGSNYIAKVWRNGVATNLTNGSANANANA